MRTFITSSSLSIKCVLCSLCTICVLIRGNQHFRSQHPRKEHARHDHENSAGVGSSASLSSSVASPRSEPAWTPDPIIPAINEYGTFGRSPSSLCSSADESERPFLFPSAPVHPSRPKVLTELVPFASFFSSLSSNLLRRKRENSVDFLVDGDCARRDGDDDDVDVDHSERRRRYTGSAGRKFRPKVAGGGRNVPLEILRCLSEWLAALDERGVVSGECHVIWRASNTSIVSIQEIHWAACTVAFRRSRIA